MTTVEEVLGWRPPLLDDLIAQVVSGRRVLAGLGDDLAAGRPPSSWIGDDAAAAARTHRVLAHRLNDLAAEVAALARGINQAAAGAAAAQRTVEEAVHEARAHGFAVDPGSGEIFDPAVPAADPALADDRRRLREELAERITQGLRAADHTDAELAQVLGLVASSLLDGGTAALVDALAAGRQAARRDTLPLPSLGGLGDVLGWWRGLAPVERRRLIAEQPGLVGNTAGIPLRQRDAANRRFLLTARQELQEELRRSTALNVFERMVAGLESPALLRDKLADLAAISAVVSAPGTSLLSLDIRGRRMVTADVGVGRVDRAGHVTHLVHGVGNRPSGSLPAKVDQARDLLARQERISRDTGDDATHAAIVSFGYEAPQLDLDDLAESDRRFFRDHVAKDAAPGMAAFLNAIDATRADDPHLTVSAHSYGSLVAAETLRGDTGVDDLVVLGGPGLGVDDVDELKVPEGRIYNVEAAYDVVADLGWFGRDPTYLEGVRQLDTAGHHDRGLTEVVGHTAYYADGSTSQYNIAAVGAGHAELAIDDTRGPDPTDKMRESGRRAWEAGNRGIEETLGFLERRVDDGKRALRWGLDRGLG